MATTTTKKTEDALIAEWIEPHPKKGGRDEYRLKRYGISVWALAGSWQTDDRDVDRVAHDYDIPREAAEAALAYYKRNKGVIDNCLDANDTAEPWREMDLMGATEAERDLITRWIEPNSHKPGRDEYWLKNDHISVWALVGYWQGVEHDVARVAHDYDIPQEAVEAALTYYERYKDLIDNRLDANEI